MRAPAIFIAHGAPSLALESDDFTRAARVFGERLSGVRAAVIVSAHWQTRGAVRVNRVAQPEVIYDFGGFSKALYSMRYDAPGSPEVAREVLEGLGAAGIAAAAEDSRGWDHGVWVPLLHLLPHAKTPLVEVSLPFPAEPAALLRIGHALAPLRELNVAIIGSGGVVHNLGALDLQRKDAPAAPWAREFDDWIFERVERRDLDALARYESAPHAQLAVPTPEHLQPLFVVAGAAVDDDELNVIHSGFQYGTLSMRSVAFTSAVRDSASAV